MAHFQLTPLQINPTTREPYLRLPSPNENIIITPPRVEDAAAIVNNMNDPAVYTWLSGPPYPYLLQHADEWLANVKATCDNVLEELAVEVERNPDSQLKIVGGCPVRILREMQEDGSDTFLGDLGVDRCGWEDMDDSFEKVQLTEQNAQKKIGDPDIVWSIGDYLASSHQGRGIMSAALGTLIREWIVPRMGAKIIRAEAFKGNIGSRRVFEKNGFVMEKTLDFDRVINCGIKHTGMYILWWKA